MRSKVIGNDQKEVVMVARLFAVLAIVGLVIGVIAVPSYACPPVVAASSYGYATAYAAPTYYQTQTVLAYPLTLLAVPAVTVAVQPAVPAAAPVQQAPVVPQAAPVQQAAPPVQQEAQAPLAVQTAPSVIVQRQVYSSYAVPYAAPTVYANTVAYGTVGCNTCAVGAGIGIGRGVIVRAGHIGRARVGLFQRLRENRALRVTARAGRAQQRAIVGRGGRGVPAATVIIR